MFLKFLVITRSPSSMPPGASIAVYLPSDRLICLDGNTAPSPPVDRRGKFVNYGAVHVPYMYLYKVRRRTCPSIASFPGPVQLSCKCLRLSVTFVGPTRPALLMSLRIHVPIVAKSVWSYIFGGESDVKVNY